MSAKKFYTEEQVSISIAAAKANPEQAHLILDMLNPIELPSDEEIMEEAYKQNAMIFSFTNGAKWMRDKILNK